MDVEDQRKLGFRIAKEAGALKTLETIKDPTACYQKILQTAASEGGLDKLVEVVLQNDPWWAYQILRSIPDIGDKRPALLQKASEDPRSALHTFRFVKGLDAGQLESVRLASAGLETPVATIYGYEMDQNGPYEGYFAVKWIHNGITYPSSADWDDKWGAVDGGFSQGYYHKLNPDLFSAALGLSIQDGDEMWPVMHAQAGQTIEAAEHFTYKMWDTNVTRAQYDCAGTVDSLTMTYQGTYTT